MTHNFPCQWLLNQASLVDVSILSIFLTIINNAIMNLFFYGNIKYDKNISNKLTPSIMGIHQVEVKIHSSTFNFPEEEMKCQ